MTTEPLTMDPPDPLRAFAGLPLLPQTIRVQSEDSIPSEPNNLNSIHQLMKSMGLRNAEKLLEESKAIVDNGSEILNANFPRFKASLDLDDHVAAKVEKEMPRERRPGLGRKRARFSMKPDTSQPNISLQSSLDVDKLQDPEEYFLACEKLENAKQELNRQMGVVADDSNINNLPTTARRRRPGILGKSVRYKHRFSSVPPDDNDTDMSSQETFKQDDLCALKSDLQKENSNDVELEELELTGLITEKEGRVNAILDELLSRDAKDLDDDRVLSILQEQFQMKPPDLSALCMPEFPDARTDYMTLGERIPKARKSVLGLPNSDKRTSGKRQWEESPQSNLTSPTPPKSPFSSLALLRKQVLKSNPLRDPFSPLNIDLNDINKNSDQVGLVKDFSKSGNLHGESNIKGMNVSDHQADRSAETNAQSSNIDISHSGSHAQMGDCDGHTDAGHMVTRGLEQLNNEQSLEKNSGGETIAAGQGDSHGSMERCNGWNHMDIRTADENSGMQNRDTEVQPSGHDITDKEKMHDTCIFIQGLSPAQVQVEADDETNTSNETETDIQNNVSCRTDEHVEDMPSMSAFPEEQEHNGNDAHTSENWSGNQNPSDQSNSAAVQNHSVDMQSALPDINPEQHIMKQHPLTKKQPRKNSCMPGNRERKALKFRPSLADAGTLFENGVRRSKRIKSRPLEFWKGERLLFGRVNESMKLVGVKYVSPSLGNMKVKSYISDEYKEVVDLAARY
ncbi:PREDICTED: uncharacterized protein LOC109189225 isoform X2 [Ipomoea nil]|uniref:uncharacterized protein LOC109189225 isoform X2 n=1 Tax=Ipomoea nil TaxID=35883 RepID=UPI000901E49D|nr:PREDICTED: uncharacterized protein LOC109189225 isoform X2 [Ipomoea nil]